MHSSKTVLKKEDAENMVLSFTPRSLDRQLPAVAEEFLSVNQAKPTSFRINELVAKQTGITEIERLSVQEKIEARALEKVKEIQELAYKEAYNLGLEEGRSRAFEEEKAEILKRLQQFDEVMISIGHIKSDLINQNEAHIVQLVFQLCQKLMFEQVQERDDRILPILRQAIELAQSEEAITVRLSERDFKFVESFKTKVSKEFDFIKKIKFDVSPEISSGGCILETNYGVIDATIEERVAKLWALLKDKLPKVKATNKT